MKMVVAIIRPDKLEAVQAALNERDVYLMLCFGDTKIVHATLPSAEDMIMVATFVWVETYAQHAQQLAAHADAYGADVRAALEMGKGFDTVALVHAQHARERLAGAVELAVTDQADALLMPTTPIEAPAIGEDYVTVDGETFPILLLLAGYTLLNNLTRLPTISVPSGRRSSSPGRCSPPALSTGWGSALIG